MPILNAVLTYCHRCSRSVLCWCEVFAYLCEDNNICAYVWFYYPEGNHFTFFSVAPGFEPLSRKNRYFFIGFFSSLKYITDISVSPRLRVCLSFIVFHLIVYLIYSLVFFVLCVLNIYFLPSRSRVTVISFIQLTASLLFSPIIHCPSVQLHILLLYFTLLSIIYCFNGQNYFLLDCLNKHLCISLSVHFLHSLIHDLSADMVLSDTEVKSEIPDKYLTSPNVNVWV